MHCTRNRLRRTLARRWRDETGASTAEYAITVLAACGFAAVLVALLASGEVRTLLMGIITPALSRGS
jgi:Flp pilus assembly pilin Flp